MDRRSWPWKKKPTEGGASKQEIVPSDCPPQQQQQQQQQQQIEQDKYKHLSSRLSAAAAEIACKDELVRQHAKVAEEAVSGWEKAEKEAACLKKELDAALSQGSALQDKVAHLDAALRECMRELRNAREEQEHRMHEAVVSKTRELDKVRQEYESKLSGANDKATECEAQKNALARLLQERARTISELTAAKGRAEAEASVIQVQKEEAEKACSSLKYQLEVASKEVEIRNQENEYNKRMADAADKQLLENVKKIARLEAECQRLRGLVKKKLPGPAAVAQMKLEAHTGGHLDGKRPKLGKETEERVLELEEETSKLKEALAKRSQELQSARFMCAKTASKLSHVEEQLERLTRSGSVRTKGSGDADEHTSADSWASALVAELEQFRKGKNAGSGDSKLFDTSSFDLMDDFAEMEQLATSTSSVKAISDKSSAESECAVAVHDESSRLSEMLSRKENECGEARRTCEELCRKLMSAEERIKYLEHKDDMLAPKTRIADVDRIMADARERYGLKKSGDQAHEEMVAALVKIVKLVQEMARKGEGTAEYSVVAKDGQLVLVGVHSDSQLDPAFKNLISASNNLLQDKLNGSMVDFAKELCQVLKGCQSLRRAADASATTQDNITKLKSDKEDLEKQLQLAKERIERLKLQLVESEELVSHLRVQLASAEESKNLAESNLTLLATAKADLESKVRASAVEMGLLQENVAALKSQLRQERSRQEEIRKSLQQQNGIICELSDESQKEREIAAAAQKLAECQRTIMVLGKQIQSLSLPAGSSRGSMDFSESSLSPSDRIHRLEEHFGVRTVASESEDEDVHWRVQRTSSDVSHRRNAREGIRKQEIYWSSAASTEGSCATDEANSSCRKSDSSPSDGARLSYLKPHHGNSGFSRFFSRSKGSQ